MKSYLLIFALIAASESQTRGQSHSSNRGDAIVVMPTSEAVDLARKVGLDQGISTNDRKRVTLELLMTKAGKPMLPGYTTLGIYQDLQLLSEVSINEKTGQLVDSENCVIYKYPNVLYLQREYLRATGYKPFTKANLSSEIGCPSLRELRVPAVAPKR